MKLLLDPENFRAAEKTLLLAVNEKVFESVNRVFHEEILERRRGDLATYFHLRGLPTAWAYR